MKTSFQIIEEEIKKYEDLDRFNAFIMGYMDYLNQDGQDEVLLLDAFLSEYFQDYNNDLFLKVLVVLFENGIGSGNDIVDEGNFLNFPNGTFFDKNATPLQKAQLVYQAFKQAQILFPEDDKTPNNRVILQFGIVLWSKDVFENLFNLDDEGPNEHQPKSKADIIDNLTTGSREKWIKRD